MQANGLMMMSLITKPHSVAKSFRRGKLTHAQKVCMKKEDVSKDEIDLKRNQ